MCVCVRVNAELTKKMTKFHTKCWFAVRYCVLRPVIHHKNTNIPKQCVLFLNAFIKTTFLTQHWNVSNTNAHKHFHFYVTKGNRIKYLTLNNKGKSLKTVIDVILRLLIQWRILWFGLLFNYCIFHLDAFTILPNSIHKL